MFMKRLTGKMRYCRAASSPTPIKNAMTTCQKKKHLNVILHYTFSCS